MLMITRTGSTIELTVGDVRKLAIDTTAVSSTLLAAERAPCGRINNALILVAANGSTMTRVEGTLFELAEVHQAVVDCMTAAPLAASSSCAVH